MYNLCIGKEEINAGCNCNIKGKTLFMLSVKYMVSNQIKDQFFFREIRLFFSTALAPGVNAVFDSQITSNIVPQYREFASSKSISRI